MPAASTAVLDRDVLVLYSSSSSASLPVSKTGTSVRLEELVKSAEKCAALRESIDSASAPAGVQADFRELDSEGTRLWNLAATLGREILDPVRSARVKDGTEQDARNKVLLQGQYEYPWAIRVMNTL